MSLQPEMITSPVTVNAPANREPIRCAVVSSRRREDGSTRCAYDNGADACMTRPATSPRLTATVEALKHCGLEVVAPPGTGSAGGLPARSHGRGRAFHE